MGWQGIHKDTNGPDQMSERFEYFAHLPGHSLALRLPATRMYVLHDLGLRSTTLVCVARPPRGRGMCTKVVQCRPGSCNNTAPARRRAKTHVRADSAA